VLSQSGSHRCTGVIPSVLCVHQRFANVHNGESLGCNHSPVIYILIVSMNSVHVALRDSAQVAVEVRRTSATSYTLRKGYTVAQ
jgi:hypothetical protein